jgi:hypothetical protein
VSSQQASLPIVHMYRAEPLVQLPTNLVSMVPDKAAAIHTSGGHERAEKKILFLMSVAQEQNAGDFGDSAGHCLPWRLRQPLPSRCFGAPPSPVTLCGRCLRHSRNPRLPSRTPATNHPPLYLCTRVAMQTMTSPAMSLPLSLSSSGRPAPKGLLQQSRPHGKSCDVAKALSPAVPYSTSEEGRCGLLTFCCFFHVLLCNKLTTVHHKNSIHEMT